MNERYIRVFELPKNLYVENAPVVISAGVLLKDSQTGRIIAQLKFKNISDKTIKALRVCILAFNTVGEQIEDDFFYEYLDLSSVTGDEFAQKIPIVLPNNSTRRFAVVVTTVIFTDDSIWKGNGEWKSIKTPESLLLVLCDPELVEQYKIEFGRNCEYAFTEERDIWICSCGEINKKNADICCKCGCSFSMLKSVDIEDLKKKNDKRLADEEEKIEKQRKKTKKFTIVFGFVLGLIAGVSIVFSFIPRDYGCTPLEDVDAEYLASKGLNISVNGYVLFGEYEQDGEMEQLEPIEWIPLGVSDNKLLMLSRYALDMCDRGFETWEETEIRELLNNEFLHYSFNEEEQKKIIPTQNDNPIVTDTNKIKISGEENTTVDTVFLLSIPEVETYLSELPERYTKATPYANSRGAYVADNGNTWWTLRTTNGNFVGAESGYGLTSHTAFRPAIWIELP